MTVDAVVAGVRRGEARAMARAISLVDDQAPEARALIGRLHPHTGRAYVVGITGPPGAGKSTLVDRLIAHVRPRGVTVGVIAVDPTSPFSGGAILGDRIRMGSHAGDEGVFVRSLATRGQLGGLSHAVHDAVCVLDAAGMQVVFVETVGVGQDEVDIAGTADVSVLVLVPGSGDDVQAIKAGIMEIADVFVVNKADREGADRVVQAIEMNQSLQPAAADAWLPPVIRTVASEGTGVDALWEAVERFRARPQAERRARARRREETRLRRIIAAAFMRYMDESVSGAQMAQLVDRLERHEIDPYTAADELIRAAVAPGSPRASQSPRGGQPGTASPVPGNER